MPIDGATGFNRCSSSQLITPGFRCGRSPVLFEHEDRHRAHIRQGVRIATRIQPLTGRTPAFFGTVTEGEQRFLATHRRALPGDRNHFVGREERRLHPARRGRERAVMATVTAEPGQRDEDLLAVGNDARTARVLQPGRTNTRSQLTQMRQVIAPRSQQRLDLGDVEGLAVTSTGQRPSHTPNAGDWALMVRGSGYLLKCSKLFL